MIRTLMFPAVLLTLAACDGTYDGVIGDGGTAGNRFGAVTAVPTATGNFAGVATADTTVVQDAAGNGYSFAYGIVNAADFGAGTGQANLAIAGVLPATDVGVRPVAGLATMSGTYQMVVIDDANAATDPATWSVTRPSGTVTADINFATGRLTGQSTDGALTLSSSGDAGFANGFAGDASYNGTAGRFAGVLGPNDAVATLTGAEGSRFYAGGFIIGR